MNIIELDIWSKFGSFIKPFSNSGGMLTYFIPPKTSIIGMIGAILGYKFNDFTDEKGIKKYSIEKLNDIKVSIQPLFSLKTKRVTFNQVSNEGIKNFRQDVLINPYYKLFIIFPDSLDSEKSIFLDRIKSQKSFFNLYMGKNEFLLNYKFINVSNCEIFKLDNSNKNNFFDCGNGIYGTLNRKNVIHADLKSEKVNSRKLLFSSGNSRKLESFYEYFIHDYPIRRENFVDFKFSPISFYAMNNNEKCYFSNIILKENCFLELCEIGDKKWISLI
ncbi:CRISPR-associated protein Cas5 [Methanobrevibacter sp. 87.7]|uniref:CRISPR-associated protein Cas5 n=1 Tax=Methanobrevibacter sp. 87.7 TaxID=387957 RepID=UPI000B501A4E|nr:CRISPR-associated protein Cas5 [Methanobrevibacter sp. 87.7]OWT33623.1 CRISPR-associated protein Cas5 [Methanobrevibacter sp. 87.7]